MRDHPDRDVTSLWLHAYDVEVDVGEADPYQREVCDAVAAFCGYYRCLPDDVDALTDEMFAAMVRLMQREADAVRTLNAKRR
jgi:hypothetical protein